MDREREAAKLQDAISGVNEIVQKLQNNARLLRPMNRDAAKLCAETCNISKLADHTDAPGRRLPFAARNAAGTVIAMSFFIVRPA